MPTCPECSRTFKGRECKACGFKVAEPDRSGKSAPKRCPCGSALMASGKCEETGNYPANLNHPPFVCPFCRSPLDWQGGCVHCYGSATSADRTTWTFPGDDYEVSGPHRVKVVSGPRKCCTPAQSHAAGKIVQAVLDREVDLPTALGMLEECLETSEPGSRG